MRFDQLIEIAEKTQLGLETFCLNTVRVFIVSFTTDEVIEKIPEILFLYFLMLSEWIRIGLIRLIRVVFDFGTFTYL